ncbi:MAG: magnesium transporter [Desulfurococcaceae archaeon]
MLREKGEEDIAVLKRWLTPLLTLTLVEVMVGVTLSVNVNLFVLLPALLILIPGLMDLRGDVYGAIGYRLNKALHLGLAEPRLLTRYNLVNALIGYSISIFTTAFLSAIGMVLSMLVGLNAPEILSLLFIALSSTLAVYIVLVPIVNIIIVNLFRRGHDPSSFVATIVTGIGDFLTPAVLIVVAYLHEALPVAIKLLFLLVVILSLICATVYIVHVKQEKDLLENLVASVTGSTGSSLGGFFLATVVYFISENPEILGVLPAFNAVIGASMGYLGSKLNLILHLKGEKPVKTFYRESVAGFIATYISILLALILVSIPSSIFSLGRILRIMWSVTIAFAAIYSVSATITYFLAILSFHHGWDPDNLVFPIMTTLVDLTGPIALSIISSLIL